MFSTFSILSSLSLSFSNARFFSSSIYRSLRLVEGSETYAISLSLSGAEPPSIFIGRQRDGRRLPRMLAKEFSSSSSSPSSPLPSLLSSSHPYASSSFFPPSYHSEAFSFCSLTRMAG